MKNAITSFPHSLIQSFSHSVILVILVIPVILVILVIPS